MNEYLSSKMDVFSGDKGLFAIYDISTKLERSGQKIIHMEIGKPDFDTPKAIKKAGIQAIEEGVVQYAPPGGIFELKEAITDWTQRKYGLEYDPESELLITVGASEAIHLVWSGLLDHDEEVMIPSPYYGSYVYQVVSADAKYVEVPVLKDGDIRYDIAEFEARITDKTKILLINSPNNPTGYVMSDEEMQAVADFAIKHDLIVVSDECYDHFVFDGEFKSIATLPGMKERTLVVNSTSKTFSMTGWRVGYILGDAGIIGTLQNIHEHLAICPTSFASRAPSWRINRNFRRRRSWWTSTGKEESTLSALLTKLKSCPFMNRRALSMYS